MEESSDYEDFSHKLLEKEIEAKDERATECRLRNTKFPYKKHLEDLELDLLPTNMRNKLPELATLNFIEGRR